MRGNCREAREKNSRREDSGACEAIKLVDRWWVFPNFSHRWGVWNDTCSRSRYRGDLFLSLVQIYISIYDSTIYDEKSTINFDNLDFIEGRES